MPPQFKPLTETEIRTIRCDIAGTLDVQYVAFARAIEQAHGIKGEAWQELDLLGCQFDCGDWRGTSLSKQINMFGGAMFMKP